MGVDPGMSVTGYGVVERRGGGLFHVTHGEIRPRRGEGFSSCLLAVYEGLRKVIAEAAPEGVAIENIFFGKNAKSLIKQGHLRGVAILAGKKGGLPIYEYSPLEIKQAVVGYGRAEKSQVQSMVKAILKLPALPPPDAADALAVAICHLNFGKAEPI